MRETRIVDIHGVSVSIHKNTPDSGRVFFVGEVFDANHKKIFKALSLGNSFEEAKKRMKERIEYIRNPVSLTKR